MVSIVPGLVPTLNNNANYHQQLRYYSPRGLFG